MEEIKEIIRAVCIASIGISLLDSLTSGTRLKNQMKFILSLAFTVVIVVPVAKGFTEFELPDYNQYIATDTVANAQELSSSYLKEQISENVVCLLNEKFIASGINCNNIELEINISETNSITISKVIISTEQEEKALEIIRANLGEEIEIVNEV